MVDKYDAPHVVVERRGGAGMLIGLAVLLLVAVVAYFLITQSRNDTRRTDAVTSAAEQVGDSAKKAGDAVERSIDPAK
ncbi:MAG: hypothetical protein A4S12_02635 [Proteobacteria bacterium SG_bin5]|nr:hypothetical protein [Sphingomonas sp.]OQW39317.1 MAG: hypothetical protein A4S12_02635 [Proteobacteria bacterium SG_bin5]